MYIVINFIIKNYSYLFRMDKIASYSDFKIACNSRCRLPSLETRAERERERERERESEQARGGGGGGRRKECLLRCIVLC